MPTNRFNLDNISITRYPADVNKATLVFVHGNTQNDTCGHGVIEFFNKKGHPCVSYDLPGHGDSSYDEQPYTFFDLVELNRQVLKTLGTKQVIYSGHSLGGMIQAATICHLKIKHAPLILAGSFDGDPIARAKHLGQHQLAAQLSSAIDHYISEGFKLYKRPKKYNYYENKQLEEMIFDIFNRRYSNPIASANNMSQLSGLSFREQLVMLEPNLLILHGEKDSVIPKQLVAELASHYHQVQLGWYPNMGHHAFFQSDQVTNAFLASYYQSLKF
ncbi:alpha/beta fold hydrolase [Aliikangiella sp. IMCC44653]